MNRNDIVFACDTRVIQITKTSLASILNVACHGDLLAPGHAVAAFALYGFTRLSQEVDK